MVNLERSMTELDKSKIYNAINTTFLHICDFISSIHGEGTQTFICTHTRLQTHAHMHTHKHALQKQFSGNVPKNNCSEALKIAVLQNTYELLLQVLQLNFFPWQQQLLRILLEVTKNNICISASVTDSDQIVVDSF